MVHSAPLGQGVGQRGQTAQLRNCDGGPTAGGGQQQTGAGP